MRTIVRTGTSGTVANITRNASGRIGYLSVHRLALEADIGLLALQAVGYITWHTSSIKQSKPTLANTVTNRIGSKVLSTLSTEISIITQYTIGYRTCITERVI